MENSETFSIGQDSFKRANLVSWKWWNNFWRYKIAESLNSFFSNFVKNLKIPGYRPHNDSLFENVSDPILQVILRYRNHRNILTIGEVCMNKSNKQPLCSFSEATRDEILKEILSLDTTKACQELIYQQRYLRKM